MKKLLATMLLAGTLSVAACNPTMYSASGSKSKLESNGYTVEVYSYEEAKVRITGLNYNTVAFDNAVFAEKGTGDNKDFFLAFYFSSVDAASTFLSANDNDNLAQLYRYAEKNLGSNIISHKKTGSHNNVAYTGSEYSFAAAI